MKNKKIASLIIVWAISIILLGAARPTYLVEKAMEVFNFEFLSKEAYVLTTEIVRWLRRLYFGALIFLNFYLSKRQLSNSKQQ